MKRQAIIMATIIVAAAGLASADWAPDPAYLVKRDMKFFEGKTPRQIARFLGHHNGIPYEAAVKALAARGDKALPLLKTLLGDTNPWIRGGAIDTLGEIYQVEGGGTKSDKAVGKMTPELKEVMAKIAPLVSDPHPAVQNALGSFVNKTRLETDATHKIILTMAGSDNPEVRMKTITMARYWLKDPETVIRLCMKVSAAPAGNTPTHYAQSHMIIARYRNDPICRQAIPVMVAFLRDKANTTPYRGFFSDGAQLNVLEVLKAQWDDKVEATDGVVAGVARCYVRVPIHDYKGWVRTRAAALELLERLKPASLPALKKVIAEEKHWLATVSDLTILTVTERKASISKPVVEKNIANLEEIAAKLEGR